MAYTTINKSTDYFNTKLYTGNGNQRNITGVGFQPDWIWGKNRSATGSHNLVDSVRGVSKVIYSNLTDSEQTDTSSFNAFGSDGFSVGSQSNVNGNGNNIVAWNWKANGQGSSNTDGSINTAYTSVNTTSGFSICKWTGSGANATIGHGMGAVPKMIIIKNLGAGEVWVVYHKSLGATKFLRLSGTEAGQTLSTVFNNTEPTSSVFSVGGNDASNRNGYNMIAYCFAEKTGYSKFGSYVGNNNADGTFVYTGFKPAFVMVKRAGGGSQSWGIVDNKRSNYNLISAMLNPNSNGTEGGNNGMDLLSNGFKMRSNDGNSNGYADTHIYMAFAEAPLVGTNGVTAKAR